MEDGLAEERVQMLRFADRALGGAVSPWKFGLCAISLSPLMRRMRRVHPVTSMNLSGVFCPVASAKRDWRRFQADAVRRLRGDDFRGRDRTCSDAFLARAHNLRARPPCVAMERKSPGFAGKPRVMNELPALGAKRGLRAGVPLPRVGKPFQAMVEFEPSFVSVQERGEECVWSPYFCDDGTVARFLRTTAEILDVPEGKIVEPCLRLLRACDYDEDVSLGILSNCCSVECSLLSDDEHLVRSVVDGVVRRSSDAMGCGRCVPAIPTSLDVEEAGWSKREKALFLHGWNAFGKNFNHVQSLVATKSVHELVAQYYSVKRKWAHRKWVSRWVGNAQ